MYISSHLEIFLPGIVLPKAQSCHMTPNRGVLFAVYSTCICLVESGVPDTLKVQEVFSVLWVLYLVEILRCNKTELQCPQIFKRPYQ